MRTTLLAASCAGLVAAAFPLLGSASGTRLSGVCSGVSPGAVSQIVGRGMPGPVVASRTAIFDKQLGITATVVSCSYGLANTLPKVLGDVDLVYEKLSKPVAPAQLLQAVKSSAGKNETVTAIPSLGLGIPGALVITTSSVGVYHSIYGLKGTNLYSAGAFTAVSISKVQALAKLAIIHL